MRWCHPTPRWPAFVENKVWPKQQEGEHRQQECPFLSRMRSFRRGNKGVVIAKGDRLAGRALWLNIAWPSQFSWSWPNGTARPDVSVLTWPLWGDSTVGRHLGSPLRELPALMSCPLIVWPPIYRLALEPPLARSVLLQTPLVRQIQLLGEIEIQTSHSTWGATTCSCFIGTILFVSYIRICIGKYTVQCFGGEALCPCFALLSFNVLCVAVLCCGVSLVISFSHRQCKHHIKVKWKNQWIVGKHRLQKFSA